jgi:hypothetical protein
VNKAQILTENPDGSDRHYLGTMGHVTDTKYSFSYSGGDDQLSCTFVAAHHAERFRTQAFNVGRLVVAHLGGDIVWNGSLLSPVPTAGVGQVLTANGSGNYGGDYLAEYTGAWSTNPDSSVNAAITRGLDWINPGIGTPAGIWLGQKVDSGAQTLTELLNLACTKGGLGWSVDQRARGNVLQLQALPTTADRLLIVNGPIPRTRGGEPNSLLIRYNAAYDTDLPAIYNTTRVVNQTSIDRHGRHEKYLDLSSAGVMSALSAQSVGNFIFQRYQDATYAGPFTALPGQLLTIGGQRINLATERAGHVIRLIGVDFDWGGELVPTQPQFICANYAWDEVAQLATITPFQNLRTDFASVVQLVTSNLKVHTHRKLPKGRVITERVHW